MKPKFLTAAICIIALFSVNLSYGYHPISPYAYCAGNPIKYVDPDGRQVVGLTKEDAQKFMTDMSFILKDDKFQNFRALVTLDKKGTSFNVIGSDALNSALNGVELSKDEQVFVNELVGAINSEHKHTVEYAAVDGNVSVQGSQAFKAHLNSEQAGLGNMFPQSQIPGATINAMSGGGLNIPVKNGSHSIIMDGNGAIHEHGRALISAHEVLGHGVAAAHGIFGEGNNLRAIQVDNLVRRLIGVSFPIMQHGNVIITDPGVLPRVLP